MPLHVVRSTSNRVLWQSCADAFLREASQSKITRHNAHIWLTHRLHRDLLLESAAKQKVKGWLKPPVHFFSGLPELFGITGKPVGLLTRREMISRIAADHGRRAGIAARSLDATLARGHMLDTFFGELLPEGVTPDTLEQHLARIDTDTFAERRNGWVVATYRAYNKALGDAALYDPRAIHALIAREIQNGKLQDVLDGAQQLHIYGLHNLRARNALVHALAKGDAHVTIYTTSQTDEFDSIANSIEDLAATPSRIFVQPAPDAMREAMWVAGQVKSALQGNKAEPHEIAVVARTGLEDTRRVVQALESAGVPATARVRTPLSEISALKAVLDLFRAAADSWSYRALRAVLASPYLGVRIDLRPFDRIACDARPASIAEWTEKLGRLHNAVDAGDDPDAKRMGIFADKLNKVIEQFTRIGAELGRLDNAKPTHKWVTITSDLLKDRGFRQRITRAPFDRYDVVRLDQRGVRQLQRLLEEWATLEPEDDTLTPGEWYQVLRSLLENNELVMTTPGQKGVQVLEAHDAALVPFKYVFVVHANDGVFPRATSNSGLFTEEERELLVESGLPVEHRTKALQRERVLWHAVTANDDVAITYRTSDPKGTPLLPSLMVPPHDPDAELPRSEIVPSVPLDADAERRIAALQLFAVQRNTPARIATPYPDALRHAILMAHAERLRGAPDRTAIDDPYHAWNGVMRDPFVLGKLDERFDAEYRWSASQLQKYATCPFLYLVERVLGFQEVEEAEEDTSPMTFGGVAHDILEAFYNDVKAELPLSLDDAAATQLVRAANRVYAEREARGEWMGSQVLWRHRKRDILAIVKKYLEWELPFMAEKGERPIDCELVLGGDVGYVTLSGTNWHSEDVTMRVAGRIDRVDVDRKGQYILDYKTSRAPSPGGYEDGVVLQAPLYIRALEAMGRPMQGGRYRALKSPNKPQYGCKVKINDDNYNTSLAIAFSIPGRVRRGLFEVSLAASLKDWPRYELDLTVRRTHAVLAEGQTRYDR